MVIKSSLPPQQRLQGQVRVIRIHVYLMSLPAGLRLLQAKQVASFQEGGVMCWSAIRSLVVPPHDPHMVCIGCHKGVCLVEQHLEESKSWALAVIDNAARPQVSLGRKREYHSQCKVVAAVLSDHGPSPNLEYLERGVH